MLGGAGRSSHAPSPDLVLGNMLQIVMMKEKTIHSQIDTGPRVHLTVDNGVYAELSTDNWSNLSIMGHARVL